MLRMGPAQGRHATGVLLPGPLSVWGRNLVLKGLNFDLHSNSANSLKFSLGGYKVLITQYLSALPFLACFFFTTPW